MTNGLDISIGTYVLTSGRRLKGTSVRTYVQTMVPMDALTRHSMCSQVATGSALRITLPPPGHKPIARQQYRIGLEANLAPPPCNWSQPGTWQQCRIGLETNPAPLPCLQLVSMCSQVATGSALRLTLPPPGHEPIAAEEK